jgi:hypothetical protein
MKLQGYRNHLLGNVIYFIIHNRQQAYTAGIGIGLFFDLASGMRVRISTARSSGAVAAAGECAPKLRPCLIHIHPTYLSTWTRPNLLRMLLRRARPRNTNNTYSSCCILIVYRRRNWIKREVKIIRVCVYDSVVSVLKGKCLLSKYCYCTLYPEAQQRQWRLWYLSSVSMHTLQQ